MSRPPEAPQGTSGGFLVECAWSWNPNQTFRLGKRPSSVCYSSADEVTLDLQSTARHGTKPFPPGSRTPGHSAHLPGLGYHPEHRFNARIRGPSILFAAELFIDVELCPCER